MKSHYKWYISMGLILLLQAWYCFDSACFWSPTHDEYWHLPVGILHWQTGKFDMDVLNPPLVRMWDAIPQFWLPYHEITVSPGQDPARHGDAFFEAYGKDVRIMLIWGRMMNVILSMMITIVIMHRVSKLAGKVAAAVAGFLWITNPNVIAHSSLVTTDLGAALAFIAVMELTFRLIKRKTAFTAVSLGIITGAALATKYTCLILPPLSLITYIFWLKFSGEKMCQSEKCRLPETNDLKVKQTECSIKTGFSLCSYKLWIIVFSTCWLTLNTCYLFEGVGLSISEMHFASNKLAGFCRQFPFINNLPSPLPAAFLQGVDQQLLVMESQHPVFLINWYEKGFPAFYAICFFFKNPLHYIILLIVGGCYVFRNKLSDTSAWKYLLTGFFWSLLLFFIASLSTMQLGIRYILPVYPVVIMISSLCFQNFNHWSRPGKSLTVVTLMIATVISLWNRPHHLSYLNVLAGGVNEGYLILEDSNYDWGQDLYALEKYYKEHKIEKIYLAYFGTAPAEKLGINFELPPDGAPVPGWYAISTNLLTGRQYPLRKPDGKRDSGIQDRYFYMRFFTPVDKAGSSIFIYQLSEKDIKHWKSEVEKYRTTMY